MKVNSKKKSIEGLYAWIQIKKKKHVKYKQNLLGNYLTIQHAQISFGTGMQVWVNQKKSTYTSVQQVKGGKEHDSFSCQKLTEWNS